METARIARRPERGLPAAGDPAPPGRRNPPAAPRPEGTPAGKPENSGKLGEGVCLRSGDVGGRSADDRSRPAEYDEWHGARQRQRRREVFHVHFRIARRGVDAPARGRRRRGGDRGDGGGLHRGWGRGWDGCAASEQPAAKTIGFHTDWIATERAETIRLALEQWTREHPNVRVDKIDYASGAGTTFIDQVVAAMSAGTEGDVSLWGPADVGLWGSRRRLLGHQAGAGQAPVRAGRPPLPAGQHHVPEQAGGDAVPDQLQAGVGVQPHAVPAPPGAGAKGELDLGRRDRRRQAHDGARAEPVGPGAVGRSLLDAAVRAGGKTSATTTRRRSGTRPRGWRRWSSTTG